MRVPVHTVMPDPPMWVVTGPELALAAGALDGVRVEVGMDRTEAQEMPDGLPMLSVFPSLPGAFAVTNPVEPVVGRQPFCPSRDQPGANHTRVVDGVGYVSDRMPLVLWRPASSQRWVISGTTRDNDGAALGFCRVVILETGRVAVGEGAVAAEAISDAAGLFSIEVPSGTDYWGIAYLPGSPDRAGISLHPMSPAAP